MQAGGTLAGVGQAVVPLALTARIGGWRVDASTAWTQNAVGFLSPLDDLNGGQLTHQSGLTDSRLRATGPILGDKWRLTVGVNLPTGARQLDAEAGTTMQMIAAPALQMPVAALGMGAGGTAGLLRAFGGEAWAAALGVSYEQRSAYSPLAFALTSGRLETRVTPGQAIHLTAGLDRVVGAGRWNLLVTADRYGTDQVEQADNGRSARLLRYTLGPQVTAATHLDLSNDAWRERTLYASARLRGAFSDSIGRSITGSDGRYVEAGLSTVRGGPLGTGFVLAIDARSQTGLTFTDALVGSAVNAVGLTLGLEGATLSRRVRSYLRAQAGSFDTGRSQSTGFGATLGFTITSRGM
jgi:hypothetical protein